jgi:NADP-dependent 3-hydroxy acid dehydrogenase YdfG
MAGAPERSLRNLVSVVTGASGGIGNAVARGLADCGARLVVVGRDPERLERTVAALPAGAAVAMTADFLVEDEVTRLVGQIRREVGRVDILVHSAGAITLGPFADLPLAALDEQYRLNVRAPFQLTQGLLPLILEARGQVAFVNSSAALAARSGVSQYGATKHAQKALADSLREEVHAAGVRVITIYAGRTATPMQERVRVMEGRAYDAAACMAPEDVASTLVGALRLPESAEVRDISIRPMREGF